MEKAPKKKRRSFMSRHPRIRSVVYGIYALLFALIGILLFPLGFIPRKWTYKLGRFVGLNVTYYVIRRKCFLNLFYAYDDRMNEKRAKYLTKKIAVNLTYSFLDCFYLWMFKWRYRKYDPVEEWSDWSIVSKSMEAGHGVVVATAHYHCFEVMPVHFCYTRQGFDGGVIARTFPSPLAVNLYTWLRKRYNILSFYNDAKSIIRTLKRGRVVGVLPDLYAKRKYKVPTTFYGKPTTTFDIHFRVAALCDCPVVPAFLMRKKACPWKYGLMFYDPIYLSKKPSEEEVDEKVQQLSYVFEYHMRRFPTGWIWFHNKWRIF